MAFRRSPVRSRSGPPPQPYLLGYIPTAECRRELSLVLNKATYWEPIDLFGSIPLRLTIRSPSPRLQRAEDALTAGHLRSNVLSGRRGPTRWHRGSVHALRLRVPELADNPRSLADLEPVDMIDHGAVVIGFPHGRGGDSVRHRDLEHLTIARSCSCGRRVVGADPVIQSGNRRGKQLVAEIAHRSPTRPTREGPLGDTARSHEFRPTIC
jgi:hypothetical protein